MGGSAFTITFSLSPSERSPRSPRILFLFSHFPILCFLCHFCCYYPVLFLAPFILPLVHFLPAYNSARFSATTTSFFAPTPVPIRLPYKLLQFYSIPPFSLPPHSPHDTVLSLSRTYMFPHFPTLPFPYPFGKSNIQHLQHWDLNTR